MNQSIFLKSKKPSQAFLVTIFLIASLNSMPGLSEALPDQISSSEVDTKLSSVGARGNRATQVKQITGNLYLNKTTKSATKKVRIEPDSEFLATNEEARVEPERVISTRKLRSR